MTLHNYESLRMGFHDWLVTQGFAPQKTPPPGKSYNSSHVELLWQCWLASTLSERNRVSQQ